jgi:sec-independent protein translocase protein TatA
MYVDLTFTVDGFFIFAQIKFMLFLFLNSISTGEVIIIMVFILMFFGSKSIPGIAKTFGRTLRKIRDATDDIKRDIRSSTSEIEKDFKGVRDDFNKSSKSVTDSFKDQTKELGNISNKFKDTLESAGKETVSTKRKPITEKLVSEEDLVSNEDTKEAQSDSEINEKPEIKNSEKPESEVVNIKVKDKVSGNTDESKTIKAKEAKNSEGLKPALDKDQKIDKDPNN